MPKDRRKKSTRPSLAAPLAPKPPKCGKGQPKGDDAMTPEPADLSLEDLRQIRDTGIQEHKRAQNTRKSYADQIQRMRKWAGTFSPDKVQVAQLDMSAGSSTADGVAGSDPKFAEAFDGDPKACSADALILFLAYKCFHQGRKESTAWSAYSAIKTYWDERDADMFRGQWRYDERTRRHVGNPATSASVQDMLKSICHKAGAEGGERTHSVAMLYEYLVQIVRWSESVCPAAQAHVAPHDLASRKEVSMHLMFRVFASVGWTVWARNFETLGLKRQDLKLNCVGRAPDFHPYHRLELVDRKGWQRRVDKGGVQISGGDQDLKGNVYHIYDQPDLPAVNMYRHLPIWIDYLEQHHYKRALRADDYLFPMMGSNGIMQPTPVTHDAIQAWISLFTNNSGVGDLLGAGRMFTTHCFRRGGAQYWFMFAPVEKRWTLARIKWWGGWAQGEHRDTLIRYLLDELTLYEQSHTDALCPEHKPTILSRSSTEHGQPGNLDSLAEMFRDSLKTIRDDIRVSSATMVSAIHAGSFRSQGDACVVDDTSLRSHGGAACIPASTQGYTEPAYAPYGFWSDAVPAMPRFLPRPPPPAVAPPIFHGAPGHIHQWPTYWPQPGFHASSAAASLPRPLMPPRCHAHATAVPNVSSDDRRADTNMPPPDVCVLNLPIKHAGIVDRSRSWRDIVDQWVDGIPDRGVVPLRDWPKSWTTGLNKRLFAQKYGQRRVIALEFLEFFAKDEARFLSAYPEHTEGHTALYDAINAAREARGERKKCISKNSTPEQRAAVAAARSTSAALRASGPIT